MKQSLRASLDESDNRYGHTGKEQGMKAGLMVPCYVDMFYPEVGIAIEFKDSVPSKVRITVRNFGKTTGLRVTPVGHIEIGDPD